MASSEVTQQSKAHPQTNGIGCHRGWTSGREVQSGRRRPTGVEAERRGRLRWCVVASVSGQHRAQAQTPVAPKLDIQGGEGKQKPRPAGEATNHTSLPRQVPFSGLHQGWPQLRRPPSSPPVAIARRQSRRKMRALHWSSCLSPPSKTNLLAIRAILPPERPRTNEAQPNRSPRRRIAVFPTRILCCHRICPAGELLSRRACVN